MTGNHSKTFIHLLGILLLMGCAMGPQYTEKSAIDSTIFRDEWFDYYNRALRRIQEKDFDNAEKDLREAVAFREKDSHGARTYGVHFQSYYPHRELGILSLRKGDYKTAEKELEFSLHSAPTSKTKYYLSEARRLRVSQENLDQKEPILTVDGMTDENQTNQKYYHISASASDDTYVRSISINGEAQLIELAEPVVPFEKEVPLVSGENRISVVVEDISGKVVSLDIPVTVDIEAPSLSLDEIRVEEREGRRRAWIQGGALDQGGLLACHLQEKDIPIQNNRAEFGQWFDVPLSEESIGFTISDKAGNVNKGRIPLKDEAGRWRVGKSSPEKPIRLASIGGMSGAILPSVSDLDKNPSITLDIEPVHRVFFNQFYITGKVADQQKITSLSIEGAEKKQIDILPSGNVYFGYLASFVEAGTYIYTIKAMNASNNTSEAILTLIYEPVINPDRPTRLSIATTPFKIDGLVSKPIIEAATDNYTKALLGPERFIVLERGDMDAIQREWNIIWATQYDNSASNPDNEKLQQRINPAGADLISYERMIGDASGMEITARIVDATKSTMKRFDIYAGSKDQVSFDQALKWLAIKIHDAFPIAVGQITKADGDPMMTTLSKKHRVLPNTFLTVVKGPGTNIITNNSKTPESGLFTSTGLLLSWLAGNSQAQAATPSNTVQAGPYAGLLQLDETIYENYSYAYVIDRSKRQKIEVGDIVISE